MASEIVEQETYVEPALAAFACYDQSVYTGWVAALGDLMMSKGDSSVMADSTLSTLGGLIYALTCAGEEVDDRQRKERQAKA